jgi:hypothetical protein
MSKVQTDSVSVIDYLVFVGRTIGLWMLFGVFQFVTGVSFDQRFIVCISAFIASVVTAREIISCVLQSHSDEEEGDDVYYS